MVQTQRTPLSSSDWFLVSNKDNLSIKIRGSITIGEDALGVLMLNGSVGDSRWFTLTVDDAGHLEITHLMPGIHLEAPGKWSTNTAGALLPAGTVIAMPNNELYVSQDLQRGRAALKVKVTMRTVSTEVPILEEAANSPEGQALGEPIVVALSVSDPAIEEPAVPILTDRVELEDEAHSVPRWMVVAAPVFVLCALVAGVFYIISKVPQQPEQTAASKQIASTEQVAKRIPPPAVTEKPVVTPQITGAAEPVEIFTEVFKPTAPDGTGSMPAADLIEPTEAPLIDVPGQLALARQLLDQGYINWPVDQNAAFILGSLLARAPDLDEALRMLDEAAEVMMMQARGAYGDGFQDSAISVLEEVMVFHPNYAPARELHMEWTRERQVQFIDSATRDGSGFGGGSVQ